MRHSLPLYRHAKPHIELWRRYRTYLPLAGFPLAVALSLLLFAASVVANYSATAYAGAVASNSVSDLVLSNTPAFEVDGLFVYGAVFLIVFIAVLCLAHPKRVPFTLYSLALFLFIRAGFITLTHIGPFPYHTPIEFTSSIGIFFSRLFFGDDLFFSGHTGIPFLMALLYWNSRYLRWIFLAWSVFFAAVVLLGHIHYSIDVASAFFITFTIYSLAKWMFPQEERLFYSDLGEKAV